MTEVGTHIDSTPIEAPLYPRPERAKKKTESEQVAELLEKAADILDRDGWTQFTLHSESRGHCALGALAEAAGEHGYYPGSSGNAIYRRAARVLGAFITGKARVTTDNGAMHVHQWNDLRVSRQHGSQVVPRTLRSAAAALLAKVR